MYTYSFETASTCLVCSEKYTRLYDLYFKEIASEVPSFIRNGRITNWVVAWNGDEIIGVMGLIECNDVSDGINIKPRWMYKFFHLVVAKEHEGNGVATGLIRMAVKFLHDRRARIILNHKRSNIIPHSTFTDLGFKLTKYDEDAPIYKWNYRLDMQEADMAEVSKKWGEYEER